MAQKDPIYINSYMISNESWTQRAKENHSFTSEGDNYFTYIPYEVPFANRKEDLKLPWVKDVVDGQYIQCTNEQWGDTFPGRGKYCFTMPKWKFFAKEGEQISLNNTGTITETFTIRYGAGNNWKIKSFDVSAEDAHSNMLVGCNNETFGDAIHGIQKTCQILITNPYHYNKYPTGFPDNSRNGNNLSGRMGRFLFSGIVPNPKPKDHWGRKVGGYKKTKKYRKKRRSTKKKSTL